MGGKVFWVLGCGLGSGGGRFRGGTSGISGLWDFRMQAAGREKREARVREGERVGGDG